jgi:DNA methylase
VTGRALAVQADAMRLPLPDAVADLVCTSPPYLWKRKYAIQHPGEIGNEPNWRLYLANLYAATDEMLRVLKPTGSIWVNLGDTRVTGREPKWLGVPVKSRLLLPERYRVGCQDRYVSQGVIVRQVQIHDKANGLPESIDDRTRDSHEDWVHLVKRPTYYAALDELREPYSPKTFTVGTTPHRSDTESAGDKRNAWHEANGVTRADMIHPLGALPGSVWQIPSHPLKLPAWLGVDHYAAFSPEWPRRLVVGFSPPGICLECGQGRVPVVDRQTNTAAWRDLPLKPGDMGRRAAQPEEAGKDLHERARRSGLSRPGWRDNLPEPATILGYACSCTPYTDHPERRRPSVTRQASGDLRVDQNRYEQATGVRGHETGNGWPERQPTREYHLSGWTPPPTRPAIVADVFGGVGTTAMVARALGRIGLSFDLSHAYSRAADWRAHHSGEWQDVIARTTGRKVRPLPKHDPAQARLL